jgi:RND superfamily putative drug exporter
VFVDATIVRMVLVPATMALMGDANWWLPRWLDRALPHIDVEGASVIDTLEPGELSVPDDASELDDDDRKLVGVG